ncbi:MAG TPA: hypothetical protein VE993_09290 [Stellaceae bacterium]|nr:hypothetical protein [Stellaceae bacterium]
MLGRAMASIAVPPSLWIALSVLLIAPGVVGCSALAPYPTVPPEPPPGKAVAGMRVAICYDGLRSSRAEVQRRAQQECPAHTSATLVDTDWRMEHCPLLLPRRATFVCTPGK